MTTHDERADLEPMTTHDERADLGGTHTVSEAFSLGTNDKQQKEDRDRAARRNNRRHLKEDFIIFNL